MSEADLVAEVRERHSGRHICLADEIERLREALRKIAEGDYELTGEEWEIVRVARYTDDSRSPAGLPREGEKK